MAMTTWTFRIEMIDNILPMHRVYRVVDGVEELSYPLCATRDEAIEQVRKLNMKAEEET
jgi:hypothetical protein